jgi:hypothetical protein
MRGIKQAAKVVKTIAIGIANTAGVDERSRAA